MFFKKFQLRASAFYKIVTGDFYLVHSVSVNEDKRTINYKFLSVSEFSSKQDALIISLVGEEELKKSSK